MKINPNNISKAQAKIIKAICTHQIDSIKNIINDKTEGEIDLTLYLAQNEVSRDRFIEELEEASEKYEELYNNPDDLRNLHPEDLSMIRHLLTNISQEYEDKYPKAISNLWRRLFLIENIQSNKLKAFDMN